jgi:hypothetical protein
MLNYQRVSIFISWALFKAFPTNDLHCPPVVTPPAMPVMQKGACEVVICQCSEKEDDKSLANPWKNMHRY